jgi:hypothetical protein
VGNPNYRLYTETHTHFKRVNNINAKLVTRVTWDLLLHEITFILKISAGGRFLQQSILNEVGFLILVLKILCTFLLYELYKETLNSVKGGHVQLSQIGKSYLQNNLKDWLTNYDGEKLKCAHILVKLLKTPSLIPTNVLWISFQYCKYLMNYKENYVVTCGKCD